MAKRFTDSCKWSKSIFSNYTTKQKLMWLYLLDACDHSGVWDINLKLMSFQLGEDVKLNEITEAFQSKITLVDDKIFIPGFICFQYNLNDINELNSSNRVHISVLERLNKLKIKPLASPYQGAKDKDKDKEQDKAKAKDKEKDKEQDKENVSKIINSFSERFGKKNLNVN